MAIKLTKHSQACVELDIDGVKIIIDPGVFDKHIDRIIKPAHALLITHTHGDHFAKEAVAKALEENPQLKVYGPAALGDELGSFAGRVIAVKPGDEFGVGTVNVKVFGGSHAPVHPTLSVIDNVTYLINDAIYHPGDSFDTPGVPVDTLLVPVSGPWMKIGEAADFVLAVRPRTTVAIHDMVNSSIGDDLALEHLGKGGVTGLDLVQLKPGKSINL